MIIILLGQEALCEEIHAFKEFYEIRVNLEGSDQNSISNGMRDAIKLIIVKVSGTSNILKEKKISIEILRPEVYINEYKLDALQDGKIYGTFSFDGNEIRKLLSKNGLPLWIGSSEKILSYLPCSFETSTFETDFASNKEICIKTKLELDGLASARMLTTVEPIMDLTEMDLLELLQPKSILFFLDSLTKRYDLDKWISCNINDGFGLLMEEAKCISSSHREKLLPLQEAVTLFADNLHKDMQLTINPKLKSEVVIVINNIQDYNELELVKRILETQILISSLVVSEIKGSEVKFFINLRGTFEDMKKILNANISFIPQSQNDFENKILSYSFDGEK